MGLGIALVGRLAHVPFRNFRPCLPGSARIYIYMYIIPALPKDIANQHVRIKDILYSKFMFYHIAIPSLY